MTHPHPRPRRPSGPGRPAPRAVAVAVTIAAAVAALISASGARARGEERPEQRRPGAPVVAARRPGTTFIGEINVGGDLAGDLSVGAVLGVGGRLRSLPPRFYLIGELATSFQSSGGNLPGLPLSYDEELRFYDLALGLRIYLPIIQRVRLLFDVLGGASHVGGVLRREELTPLELEGWRPLGVVATGLQIRWFYHLSLGMRARVVFTDDGTAALRELRGGAEHARITVTGGLTWHF